MGFPTTNYPTSQVPCLVLAPTLYVDANFLLPSTDMFSMQTATAISFMTMAAALFPEERAKVQAQLDAVVGRDCCTSALPL